MEALGKVTAQGGSRLISPPNSGSVALKEGALLGTLHISQPLGPQSSIPVLSEQDTRSSWVSGFGT